MTQNMTLKIGSTVDAPWNRGLLSLNSTLFDASGYTQVRAGCNIGSPTLAPNATTSLLVRYQPRTGTSPFLDNTVADYLALGSSGDVTITFNGGSGVFYSDWTDLAAGAIGDDVFTILAVDTANLLKQPAIGSVWLEFRTVTP